MILAREEQTAEQYVTIGATDSDTVTITVDDGAEMAAVNVTPQQARELSIRLMQAADLADPNDAVRYRGRDWF